MTRVIVSLSVYACCCVSERRSCTFLLKESVEDTLKKATLVAASDPAFRGLPNIYGHFVSIVIFILIITFTF